MDIVTIYTFQDPIAADLARMRLESEGIACFLADQHAASMPTVFGSTIGIRLQVRECDEQLAKAILRTPIEDEEDDDVWSAFDEAHEDALDSCPPVSKSNLVEPVIIPADSTTQTAHTCPSCHSDRVDADRLNTFPKLLLTALLLGLPLLFLEPRFTCKRCGQQW